MFDALVDDGIAALLSRLGCIMVVEDDAKVPEKPSKPNELTCGWGHGTILSFDRGAEEIVVLFLIFQEINGVVTKENTIVGDRLMSSWTSTPIRITIGHKNGGGLIRQKNS